MRDACSTTAQEGPLDDRARSVEGVPHVGNRISVFATCCQTASLPSMPEAVRGILRTSCRKTVLIPCHLSSVRRGWPWSGLREIVRRNLGLPRNSQGPEFEGGRGTHGISAVGQTSTSRHFDWCCSSMVASGTNVRAAIGTFLERGQPSGATRSKATAFAIFETIVSSANSALELSASGSAT